MVPVRLARRVGVEGRECREVARGERARARPVPEAARHLRPVGRLEPEVLAGNDGAAVRERAVAPAPCVEQRFGVSAETRTER